jgi:hypothetical protein
MLTQEDFYEKANKFALFKDTDSKYYTFEEYQTPVTIIIKVNDVEINRILFSPSNDLDNYGLLNNTTIPAEVSAGSLLTLETNNDINNIIISLFVTSK